MKTVYIGGEGEIVEKKSRFIATVRPVASEEEAVAFIAEMKKKYWDARHNCSAFVIGDRQELSRCSDDGEPAQTAGRPMLDVLLREEIHNVAVVVTRYFGGVLLGTGGLVRAYTSSAKLGLAAAGVCDVCERSVLTYALDYTYLAKLQNLAAQDAGGKNTAADAGAHSSGDEPAGSGALFTIENLTYTDVVQAALSCVPERADEVKNLIANLTGGQGRLFSEALTSCAKYDERIT